VTNQRPRWPRLLMLACAQHRRAGTPAERTASKSAWSPGRDCVECRVVWAAGDGPAAAERAAPPRRRADPPV
jgi:hypothetical protein